MTTTATISAPATLLDALVAALEKAAAYNPNAHVVPAAVLWTDEKREWAPLMPRLHRRMPHLLTLGDYNPTTKTGPAIWLKCMIARTLPEADWPQDSVPILYLPGVSRRQLRAIETGPPHLVLLAELQYRGVFWTQPNARDWTALAFLVAEHALCLDVARDQDTAEALARALDALAETPLTALRGRRLEAPDFDALLMPDPVRDLLRWLDNPDTQRTTWTEAPWKAFCATCRSDYGFDPEKDGPLVAAERLGRRQGKWRAAWDRFAEAPALYPGLPVRLRQARPQTTGHLFDHEETWPQDNEAAEEDLRRGLLALEGALPDEARRRLAALDTHHAPRRRWVWATLGQAPLTHALAALVRLAGATGTPAAGTTPDAICAAYTATGWQADADALDALCAVRAPDDVKAVTAALRSLYKPWLEQTAEALQQAGAAHPWPTASRAEAGPGPSAGRVLLFADALRFDVAQRLRERLERTGVQVEQTVRTVALPSVTPTAKPAVSPVAALMDPASKAGAFQPQIAANGQDNTIERFRKLLQDQGIQVLPPDETGNPTGTAWTEWGDLDRQGHKDGWKLAWRIEEVLQELQARIHQLFDAGWREVVVCTDHGWLLLPGGLPKRHLPHYLAETRWGRCASLKDNATTDLQTVPWHWNPDVRIALAPGIGVFREGLDYAHGGLSPQECFVPVLTVTRLQPPVQATIAEVVWRGFRCRVHVDRATPGLQVDLRRKAADSAASIVSQPRPVEDGQASLLVEDDQLEGTAILAVLLDAGGQVIATRPTTVAEI